MPAPCTLVVVLQIRRAYHHLAGIGLIEAENHLEQRGLTTTTQSDNRRGLAVRYHHINMVECRFVVQFVVTVGEILDQDITIAAHFVDKLATRYDLVFLLIHLLQTLQTQAGILIAMDEIDQLIDWTVQTTDDILHRQHHTERHIATKYQHGHQRCDNQILHLVDERGTRLLILIERQALDIETEDARLHTLPLPAFLLLAGVEFNLLNTVDELHNLTLIGRVLGEQLGIELGTTAHEQQYPEHIERTAQHEDKEDAPVVNEDNGTEHHDIEQREYQRQAAREERLDTVVIVDTLQDITCKARIEIAEWQTHQLGQIVGQERQVYARRNM